MHVSAAKDQDMAYRKEPGYRDLTAKLCAGGRSRESEVGRSTTGGHG